MWLRALKNTDWLCPWTALQLDPSTPQGSSKPSQQLFTDLLAVQ
jgi:hypothetical protein